MKILKNELHDTFDDVLLMMKSFAVKTEKVLKIRKILDSFD